MVYPRLMLPGSTSPFTISFVLAVGAVLLGSGRRLRKGLPLWGLILNVAFGIAFGAQHSYSGGNPPYWVAGLLFPAPFIWSGVCSGLLLAVWSRSSRWLIGAGVLVGAIIGGLAVNLFLVSFCVGSGCL